MKSSKKIDKYISSYFHKTGKILETINPNNVIVLQFFQRRDNSMLAGMQETLDLLETYTNTSKYKIRYLEDGTIINNLEIVLELEGHYQDFGKYEGMIDGILSRSTSLASNAHDCVVAAKGKKIIFMGDRADHYLMQEIDGKAVALAGVRSMSTDAQNEAVKGVEPTFGSVPHILIQNFDGDTGAAMAAYAQVWPKNKIISLVDYHNDVVAQSLESYKVLKDKLYGVRIDTSKNMLDHMFDNDKNNEEHYGVNIDQVKRLRKALDEVGAKKVKIVVSSGFNADKIAKFEAAKTPVDAYGVGQSMFKLVCNFSADATLLNGHKQAKEGRWYRENNKLKTYVPKK